MRFKKCQKSIRQMDFWLRRLLSLVAHQFWQVKFRIFVLIFFSNANALKKQQQQIFKIRHVQIFDIIWLTLSNSNLLVWKIAFFQLFITIFRSCCWRLRKNKRMILVHYIGKCCHGVNIVDNLNRSPHSGHFGLIVSKN